MRVNQMAAIRAYSGGRVQEEALFARQTESIEDQLRIAKNSDHRLILMNLVMNRNLAEETVEVLFDRDIPDVTNRLKNLGYDL